MKTLELKLKKDVLIVDLPNIDVNSKPKIIQDSFGFWIYFKIKGHKPAKIEIPHTFFDYKNYKNYKFLCKGSDITEEIASELVNETLMYEKHKVKCYRYRSYKEGFVGFDNAIESFISAVESKGFYWLKNPIDEPNKYVQKCMSFENLSNQFKLFDEKEEKTFKNPLIFVKK